jgi:serine/threonine protein kinase
MLAGRYQIVGLLGRGGMGEVYRAEDLSLGQPVALKFLPDFVAADAERLARFRTEVSVARQVSHPNVCRVYDIGEADGHIFLSMEYIDGEDLSTLLRRIGRLSPDKATEFARQLCAGLAAAHDKGVLHRDLKPANVMIDGRGRVRLADFGLAGDVGAETPGLAGNARLHGAGAVRRAAGVGSIRHLRARARAVRDVHRQGGLQRLDGERSGAPASGNDADQPHADRRRDRPGGRPRDPAVPGQGPGRPSGIRAWRFRRRCRRRPPCGARWPLGETPSPRMVAGLRRCRRAASR